jgi:hypothetical protein
MYRVHLNEDQQTELRRRAHQSQVAPRVRDRREMVRLSGMGWSIPKIALHLGQQEQTVRAWIKAFLEGGLDALTDKPPPDSNRRLPPRLWRRSRSGGRRATAPGRPVRLLRKSRYASGWPALSPTGTNCCDGKA